MEDQAKQQQKWWQKAMKPLGVIGIIVICILIMAVLVVIVMAYVFDVNVPGLRGKTLWDWLQLLIIPLMFAIGGFWFSQIPKSRDERATKQRDRTEREGGSEIEHNHPMAGAYCVDI